MKIGTTLGSYELVESLGAGGMGQVFRARDTRLGREVAIKVLPAQFSTDPERAIRFRREAKHLAALNHPSIATIYGLEEARGTHFLVPELVEGESLEDRLKRGPVPLEETVRICRQVAEGLEAAHRTACVGHLLGQFETCTTVSARGRPGDDGWR